MATLQSQSGEPGKSNALQLLEKSDQVMRAWSDVGRYLVYAFGGIAIINAALLGLIVQRIRRMDS